MADTIMGLIAESQLYREGVKALLGSSFVVTLEADGVAEALRWGEEPRLILVDEAEGREHTACTLLQERFPGAALVFLMRRTSREQAIDILRFGAHGILGPDLSADALVLSLKLILTGQILVPSFVLDLLQDSHAPSSGVAADLDQDITPRERQILEMIVRGHSNKAIGLALGLREPTVKFYVKNVMRKLHVANRTQIAVWAMTHGCPADSADCDVKLPH